MSFRPQRFDDGCHLLERADKPSRMPASPFDLVQATVRLVGEQIAPDTVCAIGAIAGDEAGLDLAGSSSLWDLALGERLSQASKPDRDIPNASHIRQCNDYDRATNAHFRRISPVVRPVSH